ncbi:MAG: response regulator [Planctomycetota bacterium]|nr:response regulator [Planctomycetota bacterium]
MNPPLPLVLLVEDDLGHAELTTLALMEDEPKAKVVHHVSDGEAALDYLFRRGDYAHADQSPCPHLILMDLRLPKVDGLEVLKEIKASSDETLRRTPVVIMTSSEASRDTADAYDGGANSYIVKPVDYEKYSRLVADLGRYWLIWNCRAD